MFPPFRAGKYRKISRAARTGRSGQRGVAGLFSGGDRKVVRFICGPRNFQTKPAHDPAWPLKLLERRVFEASAAGWRFFRRRSGEFLSFFGGFSTPCRRLEGAAGEVQLT